MFGRPYMIDCDESKCGIGAVLIEQQDGSKPTEWAKRGLLIQDLVQGAEEHLGDGVRVLRRSPGDSDAPTLPRGFAYFRADRPKCAQRFDWATHAMSNKIARVRI